MCVCVCVCVCVRAALKYVLETLGREVSPRQLPAVQLHCRTAEGPQIATVRKSAVHSFRGEVHGGADDDRLRSHRAEVLGESEVS